MRCSTGTPTPGYPLTALWINKPTFDTDTDTGTSTAVGC